MTLNCKDFLDVMNRNGYKVFRHKPGGLNLNIVGVRNLRGRVNSFDDTIAVFYENVLGGWSSAYFAATTMPGTPSLLRPVSDSGTAILVPGQYLSSYCIGLHRDEYEALVQCKPVKVYRDTDKDAAFDLEESSIEEGMFGINIHRASFAAKVVGADSAGCQVIKTRDDYKHFMTLCKMSSVLMGNEFTYTLVEI
jgi:hypothetical protein